MFLKNISSIFEHFSKEFVELVHSVGYLTLKKRMFMLLGLYSVGRTDDSAKKFMSDLNINLSDLQKLVFDEGELDEVSQFKHPLDSRCDTSISPSGGRRWVKVPGKAI